MYVETLRLTEQGNAALTSAKDNGVCIRPIRCVFGNYNGTEPVAVPEMLLGNQVCESELLRYIEIVSGNLARFAFDIPADVPSAGSTQITEALIYIEDDVPFAHVVFDYPITKSYGNIHRVSMLLYVTGTNLATVLNVTIGDHTSLPQIFSLVHLPDTSDTTYSTVLVADLMRSADGSRTPGLAFRAGTGGNGWAFHGYDRISTGALGDRQVSEYQYNYEDMTDYLTSGDSVILSIVSGVGAGSTRAGTFDGQNVVLDAAYDGFLNVTATSVLALWRERSSESPAQQYIQLPDNSDDIPTDWVLGRDDDGNPAWVPPSSSSSTAQGVVLYRAPSKLVSKSLVTTAVSSELTYELPQEVDSSADVLLAIGGVSQNKTAFDVEDNFLTLSEYVDSAVDMNARTFVREASQGHEIDIQVVTVIGDGGTSEYDLGSDITDAEQVIAVIQRLLNPITAYQISSGTLRLTEALPSGMIADFYCLRYKSRTGASTEILPVQFVVDHPTSEFRLPVSPISKEYVLVNENGALMMQQDFSIVGDILYTNIDVPAGRNVEILIFNNVLTGGRADRSLDGLITHAFATPTGIKLMRHNKKPLNIPAIRPVFKATDGIVIDDSNYPEIKISYDATKDSNAVKRVESFTEVKTQENVEELIITKRVKFTDDVTIVALADFDAKLGPGFSSSNNREHIECMISIVEVGASVPSYGSGARGGGKAGFSAYSESDSQAVAYANRHNTNTANIVAANYPAKAVDIIAKVRVVNAAVSSYGSQLSINMSYTVTR